MNSEFQAIGHADQDVLRPTRLQFVEYLHPELRALGGLDPRSEDVAGTDLQQRAAPRAGLESLSECEQEVFLRLARGETPKQAAIDMGISDKTVYVHRASVRAKLGVNSDLALHKLALERGLL